MTTDEKLTAAIAAINRARKINDQTQSKALVEASLKIAKQYITEAIDELD